MSDLTQNALAAKRVGQYLIDASVLTREQLDEALDRQRRMSKAGFHVLLGTILEEMGAIDRQSLEAIILRQRLDEGSVNLGTEVDWSPFRPVVEPPAAKANGHSYVNHSSEQTVMTPSDEDTSQEKAMLPSETPEAAGAPVNLHPAGTDSTINTATFQPLEETEGQPSTDWPEPTQEAAPAQREVQSEPSWRERLPRFPFGDRKGEQAKDAAFASSHPSSEEPAQSAEDAAAESTFIAAEEPTEVESSLVAESTFIAAEEPTEVESSLVAESTFVAAEEPSEVESSPVAESTFVAAEEPTEVESSLVAESTFVAAEEPSEVEASPVAESTFVAAEEPSEVDSSPAAETSATDAESATSQPADDFSSASVETYAAAYAASHDDTATDTDGTSAPANAADTADEFATSSAEPAETLTDTDAAEPAASHESQTDESNYSGGNDVSRSQASFGKFSDEVPAHPQGTVEIKGFQFTRGSEGLSESEVSSVIAQLVNRTRTLEAQMEDAKESLSHLDSMRRYGEESVKAADVIAGEIRSEAEKQSSAIRERAQMEARRIVLEARTQHDEILHAAGEKAQQLATEVSHHIDEHREVNNRLIERAEELIQTNTTGDAASQ